MSARKTPGAKAKADTDIGGGAGGGGGAGAGAGASSMLVIAAIVMGGLNLRPSILSVPPLLPTLQATLGMSSSLAGMLTSLPVLLIGIASPLAYIACTRLTLARVVALAMITLVAGIALRSLAAWSTAGGATLFAGTVVMGLCLGLANALIPGIIKLLPVRTHARASALLSLAICLGGAIAAGTAEPLSKLFSGHWEWALAVWAVPAIACAAMWWRLKLPIVTRSDARTFSLLNNPIAIALSLHMALQSFLSHSTSSWLPSILVARGMDPTQSGVLLSTMMAAQLATALAGAWIANLRRDQGHAVTMMYVLACVGFAGCVYGSEATRWSSAVLLGLGQGGTFSIGYFMLVLRAENAIIAARLAAMTQLFGYGLAACGPWLFGVLRDRCGDWTFALPLFAVVTVMGITAGRYAGRPRIISA